ncbi:hypothetical protein FA15DRAFT_676275 [Coprinopsis marcescibilis]|uniref:Uncharacterized protein n=1 Tax=Coprinopsis marcescibilis TaxID=230819 RepID=A0A5C3KAM7_COPMA|nr:hypothetical protein FA15DRAFT_676275 [Coprinopsis marcescibilis]
MRNSSGPTDDHIPLLPTPSQFIIDNNFTFNQIGKSASLLGRISSPDANRNAAYSLPSPSPEFGDQLMPDQHGAASNSAAFPSQRTPEAVPMRDATRQGLQDPSILYASNPGTSFASQRNLQDRFSSPLHRQNASSTSNCGSHNSSGLGRANNREAARAEHSQPSVSVSTANPPSFSASASLPGASPDQASPKPSALSFNERSAGISAENSLDALRSLFTAIPSMNLPAYDAITNMVQSLRADTLVSTNSARQSIVSAEHAVAAAEASKQAAQSCLDTAKALQDRCDDVIHALETLTRDTASKKQEWEEVVQNAISAGDAWIKRREEEEFSLLREHERLREENVRLSQSTQVRQRASGQPDAVTSPSTHSPTSSITNGVHPQFEDESRVAREREEQAKLQEINRQEKELQRQYREAEEENKRYEEEREKARLKRENLQQKMLQLQRQREEAKRKAQEMKNQQERELDNQRQQEEQQRKQKEQSELERKQREEDARRHEEEMRLVLVRRQNQQLSKTHTPTHSRQASQDNPTGQSQTLPRKEVPIVPKLVTKASHHDNRSMTSSPVSPVDAHRLSISAANGQTGVHGRQLSTSASAPSHMHFPPHASLPPRPVGSLPLRPSQAQVVPMSSSFPAIPKNHQLGVSPSVSGSHITYTGPFVDGSVAGSSTQPGAPSKPLSKIHLQPNKTAKKRDSQDFESDSSQFTANRQGSDPGNLPIMYSHPPKTGHRPSLGLAAVASTAGREQDVGMKVVVKEEPAEVPIPSVPVPQSKPTTVQIAPQPYQATFPAAPAPTPLKISQSSRYPQASQTQATTSSRPDIPNPSPTTAAPARPALRQATKQARRRINRRVTDTYRPDYDYRGRSPSPRGDYRDYPRRAHDHYSPPPPDNRFPSDFPSRSPIGRPLERSTTPPFDLQPVAGRKRSLESGSLPPQAQRHRYESGVVMMPSQANVPEPLANARTPPLPAWPQNRVVSQQQQQPTADPRVRLGFEPAQTPAEPKPKPDLSARISSRPGDDTPTAHNDPPSGQRMSTDASNGGATLLNRMSDAPKATSRGGHNGRGRGRGRGSGAGVGNGPASGGPRLLTRLDMSDSQSQASV